MKEQYTHEILAVFNLKENQDLSNNEKFLKIHCIVNRILNDGKFIGRNKVKRHLRQFCDLIEQETKND